MTANVNAELASLATLEVAPFSKQTADSVTTTALQGSVRETAVIGAGSTRPLTEEREKYLRCDDGAFGEVWAEIDRQRAEVARLERRVADMREALERVPEFAKWTQHHPTCNRRTFAQDGNCSCGLSALWLVVDSAVLAGGAEGTYPRGNDGTDGLEDGHWAVEA